MVVRPAGDSHADERIFLVIRRGLHGSISRNAPPRAVGNIRGGRECYPCALYRHHRRFRQGNGFSMILVIDVGNTRLKWAWLTSTGLSDQQAVVHRDAKPGIWTTALFESGQRPSRVLVSNVAGPVMAKTLTRLTKKVFRVKIEFVTASPEYHGLTNGYLDRTLLGADRWLALIV